MTDMHIQFMNTKKLLLNLLDSPVTAVHHIGATALGDTGVLDILVIVPSLHAMTTLDEKRLNQAGFYRMHHPYHKKCVFSQFDNLTTLKEKCRLHIVEANSDKANYYLNSQVILEQSPELYEQFKSYKKRYHHLPKKEYETKKADWFRMFIANKH